MQNLEGTILSDSICQHKMWQPCCYVMTRAGSRLRSTSIGLGSHLHIHQHNHGIFELVPIRDTQIKSSLPIPFTILLHLKSHSVWVRFFMLQVLKTDDPSNREDFCWNLVMEKVDVIQFISCTTMTTLQVMSEWPKELYSSKAIQRYYPLCPIAKCSS